MSNITGVSGTVTATAGGVTVGIGTAEATTRINVFDFTATATTTLVFTPFNTARFTIDDISLKPINGQIRSYRDVNLVNTTLATPSAQQRSPVLLFGGQGWKSTATAASQPASIRESFLPITGTSNITGRLEWQSSVNGGAYVTLMTLGTPSNGVTLGTGTGLSVPGIGSSSERFGSSAAAGGNSSVALGASASAGASGSVAIGTASSVHASATNSLAIGSSTAVGSAGIQTLNIGSLQTMNVPQSVAIGVSTLLNAGNAVAIGYSASVSGLGGTALGRLANAGGASSVAIGPSAYANGDTGVAIGSSSFAQVQNSFALGSSANAATTNGLAIGTSAVVTGNSGSMALGFNANNTFGGTGSAGLYGFDNHFFGAEHSAAPVPAVLGTSNISSGLATDTAGSDMTLQPGLSTGSAGGGTLYVQTSKPGSTPGSTQNTPLELVKVQPTGVASFSGNDQTLPAPSNISSNIQYADGSFFTGINTSGQQRDYQVYSYNGTIFSTTSLDYSHTDDNSTVSLSDTSSISGSTVSPGVGPGYTSGDNVEYQVYAICTVNTNGLYNPTPAQTSGPVSVSNTGDEIAVTWTGISFPAPCDNQAYRVLRQVNSGGYNDYFDVTGGGTSFTDPNSGWTGGGVSGSTTVQNFFKINATWTDGVGSTGAVVLRQIAGGGFNAAIDVTNTQTLVDSGQSFPASTTVSPTSVPRFKVVLNDTGSPIEVQNSAGTTIYKLPKVDGASGDRLTTDGAGNLYWAP